MSEFEERRIIEKFGCLPPYDFEHHACGFLNQKTNKCKIYDIRPAICRLFGTVLNPLMRCPHNCAPFQLMSNFDSHFILHQIAALR